ncbi:stage V sporulation protein AB [Niameybacter massiliensis]|uniref:Stage V sporulation protein AB n=1 Tax=Holtiella tumoricola TaxID=3018743 RepID=A0AA42DRP4_9FIRM|nr:MULTISPECIES: stage V sporulation protein AB [Lachnospirales]MDA3733841.1 stage V sporulation protein AB [Holtiella tumoricola]
MKILMLGVSILWGFASGIIIATGILAFITAIGVIPRLAMKLQVKTHYFAIANASALGIVVGNIFYLWDDFICIGLPKVLIAGFGLADGIFIGCLAMALAEVLDVMPITKSRLKLKRGMYILVVAFSIGKMVGTLFYYLYPGFL